MAHIRQSRPDSGLGFRVQFLNTFQVVPSLLGSGWLVRPHRGGGVAVVTSVSFSSYISYFPCTIAIALVGAKRGRDAWWGSEVTRGGDSGVVRASECPCPCLCVCLCLCFGVYVCDCVCVCQR